MFATIDAKKIPDPTPLHVDNQSAIKVAHNQSKTKHWKHIDIREHHLAHHQHHNSINLRDIPSDRNLADALSKSLYTTAFNPLNLQLFQPPHSIHHTPEHPGV